MSFLGGRHQQRILGAHPAWADEPGFATVASLDDLADNVFSLAIPLHVSTRTPRSETDISVEGAAA